MSRIYKRGLDRYAATQLEKEDGRICRQKLSIIRASLSRWQIKPVFCGLIERHTDRFKIGAMVEMIERYRRLLAAIVDDLDPSFSNPALLASSVFATNGQYHSITESARSLASIR
jgi:hypothetical protein